MRWTGQERRPPASLGPRAARLQATSRSRGRRRRRACPTTSRDRPRRSGGPLRRSGSRGRSSEPTPWRARAGARTSHDRPRPCSRQHPRCARTRPGWPDRAARRPAARRAGGRRLRSWRGGWWDRPRSLGARTCRRGVPRPQGGAHRGRPLERRSASRARPQTARRSRHRQARTARTTTAGRPVPWRASAVKAIVLGREDRTMHGGPKHVEGVRPPDAHAASAEPIRATRRR